MSVCLRESLNFRSHYCLKTVMHESVYEPGDLEKRQEKCNCTFLPLLSHVMGNYHTLTVRQGCTCTVRTARNGQLASESPTVVVSDGYSQ